MRVGWTWLVLLGGALLGACSKAVVRQGLTEQEANQIVVALDRSAIAASKVAQPGAGSGAFGVEVAAGDVASALALIEARRLPEAPESGFDALYREPQLIATPQEERARWVAATAGELARSLRRMPGVADAHVHLAPADAPAALDAPPPRAKASVLIERRRGAPPLDQGSVRALVAGALNGLEPDRVSVIQSTLEAEPQPQRAFARVGPVTVAARSAGTLRALLAASLGLDLLMAAALIAVLRRRRRAG